tara:strand:- start:1296 stop:1511 length:216 start_codon:yes stop_codon:yes gene_type:complete
MRHYAGGIIYDNDHGEMEDTYIQRPTWSDLICDLSELMQRRRSAEVLFGVYVDDNEKEKDMTEELKRSIHG